MRDKSLSFRKDKKNVFIKHELKLDEISGNNPLLLYFSVLYFCLDILTL